ncbi:serine/threonine-protein phosphatase [Candidatus Parcubacteria bacterium]|nr:MAG: serine/threonine-protein phosphatase [Candidatus Parcubacteria bacterium]
MLTSQFLPKVEGYSDIGAMAKARSWEDRYLAEQVVTAGNLQLTIMIVCDGMGGGKYGEWAAEQATREILRSIESSNEKDIPKLLAQAIGKANRIIYEKARKSGMVGRMGTTAAVAAIHKQRLYIANVGDSRIYLVNEKTGIQQITVDHTWAFEMIRKGRARKEDVYDHPDASRIGNFLGRSKTVWVDLGLYIHGDAETPKDAYLHQGLRLTKNDLVLVCSDGLVEIEKDTEKGPGKRLVSDNEILSIMTRYPALEAAKVLVSTAVGRNVTDNVTAVVAEMPGREIKERPLTRELGRRLPWAFSPMLAMLASAMFCVVGTFAAWMLFRPVPQSPSVVPSLTPLPTLTPHPTPPPNYAYLSVVGGSTTSQVPGRSVQIVHSGNIVPFQSGSLLRVESGLTTFNTPGNFLVQALGNPGRPTIIELYQSADRDAGVAETILKLQEGRIVVIGEGNTPRDIRFVVETVWGRAIITGTIMGGQYDSSTQVFDIDCFTGHCVVETRMDSVSLNGGEHVRIDVGGKISQQGRVDYNNYTGFGLNEFITPTPVPTPSPETGLSPGYGIP